MDATEVSGKIWRYTHTHDPVGRVVILQPNGNIDGHFHENEATWEIRAGALVFLSRSNDVSVRFTKISRAAGKTVAKGDFVLWPNSGVTTRLVLLPLSEKIAIRPIDKMAVDISVVEESKLIEYLTINGDHDTDKSYLAPELTSVRFKDVTLHTKFCLIENDREIVSESFFQFPFHSEKSIAKIADSEIYRAPAELSVEFDTALLAISGVSGNYYHWMMFFIAKMMNIFYKEEERKKMVTLLPEYLSDAQRESAEIVAEHYGLNIVHVLGDASLRVKNLIFPFQPHSSGLDTHPATVEIFDIIKSKLHEPKIENAEKIYITRSDSNFRRLANEAEIEAYLVSYGFTIVSLTGKTLKEQVNILAAAKIIISPHGAGLTNLMYCSEGTRVFEFHSPAHINWCMKRICALRKLPYMHIIGEMAPELGGDTYKIDMSAFQQSMKLLLAEA